MSIIEAITPCLVPYITINGLVPGETYRYAAREKPGQGPVFRPVIDCTLHMPKSRKQSIIYIAVTAGADLNKLQPGEKLYVGSPVRA